MIRALAAVALFAVVPTTVADLDEVTIPRAEWQQMIAQYKVVRAQNQELEGILDRMAGVLTESQRALRQCVDSRGA